MTRTKCDLCSESFYDWYELGEHVAHVHIPQNVLNVMGKIIVTCWCGDTFGLGNWGNGYSEFGMHISPYNLTQHILAKALIHDEL